MHFWAEVRLGKGFWMIVEPTPGYELRKPIPTLWERIGLILANMAEWAWRNRVLLASVSLVLVVAGICRRQILDFLATGYWWFVTRSPSRQFVYSTLLLLEWRCRLAGRRRPEGTTLSRWFGRLGQTQPEELRETLKQMTALLDWAVYSEDRVNALPEGILTVCRRIVREFSLRRLRIALRKV
jgi:hypothetical protein